MKHQLIAACTAVLFTLFNSAAAQVNDSLATRYTTETIQLDGNFNRYYKNNARNRVGISGENIAKEFISVSPETKKEFNNYQKHRRRSVRQLIIGGLIIITGVATLPISAPVYIISAPGLLIYYSGMYHLYKSRRGLQKSVWLRNRDVLVAK